MDKVNHISWVWRNHCFKLSVNYAVELGASKPLKNNYIGLTV